MRTVTGRTDRVVVVGAGLSGLAAALHLAGRDREVVVVEREPVPGGRAGRLDVGGYRLDTGPTVLTMPDIVAETLDAVGASIVDWLDLVPLSPVYEARFADGSRLAVRSDAAAMADEVRAFAGPREAQGYLRLRDWLGRLYRAVYDRFIAANTDSPLSLLSPRLARVVALGGFGTLERQVGRFLLDERLRRVFTFQSLYAGVAPRRALAVYGVIAYMDTVAGVFFPRGGVRALPDALTAAARAAGVRFEFGAAVTALERHGTRVTAVRTEGDRFPCDAVVLTTEPRVSYRLLGRTPVRPVPLRAAPSAVVVHLGVPGTADLGHHVLSFGAAWRRTFDELIVEGRTMTDPSLLVTRPTATDPGLAPAGHDLVSVLAPAPNLDRGRVDWDRHGDAYVSQVLAVAEQRLPGLTGSAEVLHTSTPRRLGPRGPHRGHPVQLRPLPRPDRTVPAGELPPGHRQRGARRRRHGARGGRADGADLGTAGRRPDHGHQQGGVVPMTRRELDAAGITEPALRAAYTRCRVLNATHGRTYFLATRLLAPHQRPAVHALYGFARWVDDLVDEPGPEATPDTVRAAIDRAERELSAGFTAGRTGEPVVAALVHAAGRYDVDRTLFTAFLRSMRMDLDVRDYPTRADLERYTYGSARVIGLQMLPVLGTVADPAEAAVPAAALGEAFQLTNFLRDVAEDLDRDRVYLPADELAATGVDRDRLTWCRTRGTADPPVRRAIADQIAVTRTVYRLAVTGIPMLRPESRPCIATAYALYAGILDRIEAMDHDVFAGRAAVGTGRKLRVAVPALARAWWLRRGTSSVHEGHPT